MLSDWLDRLFCQCIPASQPFYALNGVEEEPLDDFDGGHHSDDAAVDGPRLGGAASSSASDSLKHHSMVASVDIEMQGVLLCLEALKAEKAMCGKGGLPLDRMVHALRDMLKVVLHTPRVVYDDVHGGGPHPPTTTRGLSIHKGSKGWVRETVCCCIVRKLLSHERRMMVDVGDALAPFAKALVDPLPPSEKDALHRIMAHLPPSVLGDESAREATRVFLNLRKDVYAAQDAQLRSITPHAESVDIITAILKQCIDGEDRDESRLSPPQRHHVVSQLAAALSPAQHMRLVLEQLVLGKEHWLPHDVEERAVVVENIFSSCATTRTLM